MYYFHLPLEQHTFLIATTRVHAIIIVRMAYVWCYFDFTTSKHFSKRGERHASPFMAKTSCGSSLLMVFHLIYSLTTHIGNLHAISTHFNSVCMGVVIVPFDMFTIPNDLITKTISGNVRLKIWFTCTKNIAPSEHYCMCNLVFSTGRFCLFLYHVTCMWFSVHLSCGFNDFSWVIFSYFMLDGSDF